MPYVDKGCEGPGATHYHACDCREEHFKELESQLAVAREALEYVARRSQLSLDKPDFRLSEPACNIVRAALEQIGEKK